MNIELLQRVKAAILAEPRQFVMDTYFSDKLGRCNIPNCGTAACIAGWVCVIGGNFKNPKEASRTVFVGDKAQTFLEINNFQRDKLFLVDSWPYLFNEQYESTTNPEERARIAAARIDHLIATGE